MRDLQRQNRFRKTMVKESSFSAKSMDDSYKFIYHCYHCLFITTKISHHTCCHLEENISEKARSLFGYTHSEFILTRPFHNWISTCVLYKLLCIGEVSYIFNFSQKRPRKSLRDTFYGGNQFHLFLLVLIYSVHKHLFKLIYSWLKEKEFVDVEDESFRKVRVINADGVFSSLDNLLTV